MKHAVGTKGQTQLVTDWQNPCQRVADFEWRTLAGATLISLPALTTLSADEVETIEITEEDLVGGSVGVGESTVSASLHKIRVNLLLRLISEWICLLSRPGVLPALERIVCLE